MTDGELAAIRERCEKATVGRWNPRIASDDIPALLAEVDRLRAEAAQMREEREWLRYRAAKAGFCYFGSDRDAGRSSNAMVEYALGGSKPSRDQYPRDKWDLLACKNCRNSAPPHLRAKMDEIIAEYEAALEGGPGDE